MQPTLVKEPCHRSGWVYQEKVDGYRMLAYKDGKRVRLVSRNDVHHSKRYPELVAAVASLPGRTLVLDGEVAIFDQQLRSRFDWLRDPDPDSVASPTLLMCFDLLYRNGRDLSARPLHARRARLEELLTGARSASSRSAAWPTTASRHRPRCLSAATRALVGKDEASP